MSLIAAMSLAGSIAMFFFLFPVPRIKYYLPYEARDFLPGFIDHDTGWTVRFGASGYTAIPLGSGEYMIVESWKVVYAAVGVCAALGFIGYQTLRYFRLKTTQNCESCAGKSGSRS